MVNKDISGMLNIGLLASIRIISMVLFISSTDSTKKLLNVLDHN